MKSSEDSAKRGGTSASGAEVFRDLRRRNERRARLAEARRERMLERDRIVESHERARVAGKGG
jgi:hypothetical protein